MNKSLVDAYFPHYQQRTIYKNALLFAFLTSGAHFIFGAVTNRTTITTVISTVISIVIPTIQLCTTTTTIILDIILFVTVIFLCASCTHILSAKTFSIESYKRFSQIKSVCIFCRNVTTHFVAVEIRCGQGLTAQIYPNRESRPTADNHRYFLPILYTPHPPVHADVTVEHLDQEDKVKGF